jgi:hypothetical protein
MAEPLRIIGYQAFPSTPYFGIKRHFINIDSRTLRGIMVSKKLLKVVSTRLWTVTKNEVEVEVPWISDDYIWNMAFDFKGLATNKWKFTGMLDLDAVCGCFHFKTKSLTPRLSPWNS